MYVARATVLKQNHSSSHSLARTHLPTALMTPVLPIIVDYNRPKRCQEVIKEWGCGKRPCLRPLPAAKVNSLQASTFQELPRFFRFMFRIPVRTRLFIVCEREKWIKINLRPTLKIMLYIIGKNVLIIVFKRPKSIKYVLNKNLCPYMLTIYYNILFNFKGLTFLF